MDERTREQDVGSDEALERVLVEARAALDERDVLLARRVELGERRQAFETWLHDAECELDEAELVAARALGAGWFSRLLPGRVSVPDAQARLERARADLDSAHAQASALQAQDDALAAELARLGLQEARMQTALDELQARLVSRGDPRKAELELLDAERRLGARQLERLGALQSLLEGADRILKLALIEARSAARKRRMVSVAGVVTSSTDRAEFERAKRSARKVESELDALRAALKEEQEGELHEVATGWEELVLSERLFAGKLSGLAPLRLMEGLQRLRSRLLRVGLRASSAARSWDARLELTRTGREELLTPGSGPEGGAGDPV